MWLVLMPTNSTKGGTPLYRVLFCETEEEAKETAKKENGVSYRVEKAV